MTARRALIGHTGFVGSTLHRSGDFTHLYNSKSIGGVRGKTFSAVVCAGVSAKKWLANREPENDRREIQGLIEHLDSISTDLFVLISTIDVYADPKGVDEAIEPVRDGLHPYGLHRLELEGFVARRFPRSVIIRLPALFGRGLRKNIIFDMMNNNMLETINPATRFQWYPMERLQDDIGVAVRADLRLLHLAPPPIRTSLIHERFFSAKRIGPELQPASFYDMHSRHAGLFGSIGRYVMSEEDVMTAMARFVVLPPGEATTA